MAAVGMGEQAAPERRDAEWYWAQTERQWAQGMTRLREMEDERGKLQGAANRYRGELLAKYGGRVVNIPSEEWARYVAMKAQADRMLDERNAYRQQMGQSLLGPLKEGSPISLKPSWIITDEWRQRNSTAYVPSIKSRLLEQEARILALTANQALAGKEYGVNFRVGRASYTPGEMGTLNIDPRSDRGERSFTHELGHWIEDHDPRARDMANDFLKERTKGERAKQLPRAQGYGPGEKAKADKFTDPYVGKQYPGGTTEVVSMGLEYMMHDPSTFMERDPGHFKLMVEILKLL
jgi:hypothetical protein